MQVVVFADDPTEGRVISGAMREFGITAAAAPDLVTRMERWEEDPGDVIVLACNRVDLPLQELDTIREVTKAVPILVLHEPVPDTQECLLLERGVALMLDRPVSLRLLSNYLKVFSRLASSVPSTILNEMALEHIVLDTSDRTVSVQGGEPVRLTQLEFRLLYLLMSNQEHVVPTDSIAERVWGYHGDGDSTLVRGLVSRLRRKLEPASDSPHFIENIPGLGYRFHAEPLVVIPGH